MTREPVSIGNWVNIKRAAFLGQFCLNCVGSNSFLSMQPGAPPGQRPPPSLHVGEKMGKYLYLCIYFLNSKRLVNYSEQTPASWCLSSCSIDLADSKCLLFFLAHPGGTHSLSLFMQAGGEWILLFNTLNSIENKLTLWKFKKKLFLFLKSCFVHEWLPHKWRKFLFLPSPSSLFLCLHSLHNCVNFFTLRTHQSRVLAILLPFLVA